jgi:alanine racemase
MTFSLTIDAASFRTHLQNVTAGYSKVGAALTPVIKGNGYGFGRGCLAHESKLMEVSRIAVGNVWELNQALIDFAGEIAVLEPFVASDITATQEWKRILQDNASRVIATLSSTDIAGASTVGVRKAMLEAQTSLSRFGLPENELIHAADAKRHNIEILGLSLHLPIADPAAISISNLETSTNFNVRKLGNRVGEVLSWLKSYQSIASDYSLPMHVSLSHVTEKELAAIKQACSELNLEFTFEVRIGTKLWLGAPKALKIRGSVLEVHELGDHQHVGYQQVDGHGHKRLVVVSGGTAHGVALAAPLQRTTIRKKGIAVAEGLAQAFGKVKSPFSYHGANLLFAEPPHMHVSLLWTDDLSLKVGDQLDCNVRNTTTAFDVILGLD